VFLLEFLDLKDEYSETDLEDALICHLQTFLLQLGDDFTFVGRHANPTAPTQLRRDR
jgi:predicted nuclease of restriction endonuclease-like (RecB) superfamily